MSPKRNNSHSSVYESIMRGLHEAVALEDNGSGKACYVCYEENSPMLANEISTIDDRGWISAMSVMESAAAAAAWIQARILEGRENGFQLIEWREDMDHGKMIEMLKYEGILRIGMVDMNANESERWYDIVVMNRLINKEYQA